MKMFLVDFDTGQSTNLSIFDAHKIALKSWKDEEERKTPYEFFRTSQFVIFEPNRKQKTRMEFKFARAFEVLAEKYNVTNVEYEYAGYLIHIIHFPDLEVLVVPEVRTKEELEFFIYLVYDKLRSKDLQVVSTTKSDHCAYMTFEKFPKIYDNLKLPDWFRPFVKHRHFRQMNTNGSFNFQTRTYADSAKSTIEEKYRKDFYRKKQIPAKCYFSLAGMIDPIMEMEGNGRPFDRILEVYDIDADKDHGIHRGPGICPDCLSSARKKLDSFKEILTPRRVLFSGKKGFHVHMGREISEKEMLASLEMIEDSARGLVDRFIFEDEYGELRFDTHRIFKVPETVDLTTGYFISENFHKIPKLGDNLNDKP